MRRIRRAWGLTLVTAGLQLACPLGAYAEDAAALVRPNVAAPLAIRDIKLDHQGTLRGQVLSTEGAPLAKASVALSQLQKVVGETATDQEGRFELAGLRGGTYELRTQGTSTWVRLWSHDGAPPAAINAALLVADRPTVRGQINYMNNNMLLRPEAIGTLMIPAAVAGGVIALKQHHEQDKGS